MKRFTNIMVPLLASFFLIHQVNMANVPDRLYSVKVTNYLGFADDSTLTIKVIPCKADGSGHTEDYNGLGKITYTGDSQIFTNITWGVNNKTDTSGKSWCVENLHMNGPFTQWGSAYCSVSLKDMDTIWNK